jgi:CheY-like chemotaxis protein
VTGPKRTVLVVEDDDDIRESLLVVLEDEGYAATAAPNGRVALELLAAGARPDLILLDLMMPVLNGWELIGKLSEDPALRATPIVVISAVSDRIPRPAGAVAYLEKPVALADLLRVVKEHTSAARRDDR